MNEKTCTQCGDAHPERQRNRRSAPGARWEEKYRRRIKSFGLEPIVKPFTHDQLVARYGDGCVYCDGRFEEIDHVRPISRGGEHSIENVRPCCATCNRKKRNREVGVVNK